MQKVKNMSVSRGYLQLMRIPGVCTAVADVAVGAYLVSSQLDARYPILQVALLCVVSACLYASGMILNDCFDISEDRALRPERPLPLGIIPLSHAALLGVILMLIANCVAVFAGYLAPWIAACLSISILLYNAWFKKFSFIGDISMGSCRGLNLILGMTALQDAKALLFSECNYGAIAGYNEGLVLPVIAMIIYISLITAIARRESQESLTDDIPWTMMLLALLVSTLCFIAWQIAIFRNSYESWVKIIAVLLPLIITLTWRSIRVLRYRRAVEIQRVVRISVLGVIALDASFVLFASGNRDENYMLIGLFGLFVSTILLSRSVRVE